MRNEMSPAVCERVAWDSDFFGLRIVRVTGDSLSTDILPRVKAYCEAERIDCVYLLANANDVEASSAAQAGGFQLMDIRVTFERCIDGVGLHETPAVRSFQPADGPALRAIAAVGHR